MAGQAQRLSPESWNLWGLAVTLALSWQDPGPRWDLLPEPDQPLPLVGAGGVCGPVCVPVPVLQRGGDAVED